MNLIKPLQIPPHLPQCSYGIVNDENFYYNTSINYEKNVNYCNLPLSSNFYVKNEKNNKDDDDETQFMNITDKIYENLNLQYFDVKQEKEFAPTISTTTKTNSERTASTSSGVSSSNQSSNDGCFGDEPELYGIILN